MQSVTNYRLFFFIGIILEALGVILAATFPENSTIGIVFISMGLLIFIVGIKNKGKWKK